VPVHGLGGEVAETNTDSSTWQSALARRTNPEKAGIPVIHIEVETGNEYCEKTSTVKAAPISIEHPRDGLWYVILLPMTCLSAPASQKLVEKDRPS
jgi:hypothetical protein